MDDLVVCPSCKGMGHTRSVADEFRFGGRRVSVFPCRLCNGHGRVDRWAAYDFADRTRSRTTWGTSMAVSGY